MQVLESLPSGGDCKARIYLCSIRHFDFIICLCARKHGSLSHTVALSNMLQGKNQDVIEAANESQVVMNVLKEERDKRMLWDELFERAKEMAGEWNIDPRITRLIANQHTQGVLAKSTLLTSSRSLDTRAQ